MKFAIYHRQKDEKITFYGQSEWPCAQAFVESVYPGHGKTPPVIRLLPAGFADTSAYWVGDWGYSAQAEKAKFRGVCLTDSDVEIAKNISGGNITKGIRIALRVIEQIDDLSPYL